MKTFAVCTALYEAGRPCLPAYMAGLRAAARGEDLRLVVAIDDFADPQATIDVLAEICPVHQVTAPARATPARVRRALIARAMEVGADGLIFADMDDMLAANAPGLYRDALEVADFAYGDLHLMDASGEHLQRRFFDDAEVPWRVGDAGAVAARNFLGLSNTALRSAVVSEELLQIPADIVAVDWWLFTTLLLRGRTGRRTAAPVGSYRVYDANMLGSGAPGTPEALARTIASARRHYAAFPAAPALVAQGGRIEALEAAIATRGEHAIAAALAALRDEPCVWFEILSKIDLGAGVMPAAAAVA